MTIGNNFFGINILEDYISLYVFPFGIELLLMNGIEIAFVFLNLEFTITIKENITLFRGD